MPASFSPTSVFKEALSDSNFALVLNLPVLGRSLRHALRRLGDEAQRRSWRRRCSRRRRQKELLEVHELRGNFALADAHLAESGAVTALGSPVKPDQGVDLNEVHDAQAGDHDAGVHELLLEALLGLIVSLVVLLTELVQPAS